MFTSKSGARKQSCSIFHERGVGDSFGMVIFIITKIATIVITGAVKIYGIHLNI